MMEESKAIDLVQRGNGQREPEEILELAVFKVGEIICAVEITEIQEINRNLDITPVDNAPEHIRGMMNLRGNIITVVDMRAMFSMKVKEKPDNDTRILVVESEGELIGLFVDKMLDVIQAPKKDIEPPPSNIQGVAGRFFSNIYKMEDALAGVLDLKEILKTNER